MTNNLMEKKITTKNLVIKLAEHCNSTVYTLSHPENDSDDTDMSASKNTRCKTHPVYVNLGVPF